MFKTQLIFSAFLFIALGILIALKIFHVEKKDHRIYQELLESSSSKRAEEYSQQRREKVCKEVWYQDKTPLHMRIESDDSTLFFFHQNNQAKVVEQLGTTRCMMQEELYYLLPDGREAIPKEEGKLLIRGEDPSLEESWIASSLPGLTPMQLIRYFEADKACYNYATQLFLAEGVKLWQYRIEAHQLPSSLDAYTPLMSGTARRLEITLNEKKFDFQSDQMRATFKEKLF